jgi:SAM-dependent methyltransferase
MTPLSVNRFDDFFADTAYVALKNLLYNYLLRKRAIKKCLQQQEKGLILEVGSGLSPTVTDSDRVIYSELSFAALRNLKKCLGKGSFVAADAAHLPFRAGAFAQVICSEVLEHLQDDRSALREMAAVMKPGGSLILTFPHRRGYFAGDDRFVNHLRRYEVDEMEERLREAGLNPVEIKKVLGPLEKMTMMAVISLISVFGRFRIGKRDFGQGVSSWGPIVFAFRWLNQLYCAPIWLDARLAPRCLSAVLLIRAIRQT